MSEKPDLKIDCLYAYIAQSKDGEGVMGMSLPIDGRMTMLPMVGADVDRIKSLLPIAKQIADQSGFTFRIYKFENKVDITEEIELY
jgi:hypothetical protein